MKIDLGLAAMILNPMVCAILIGGILLGVDVAVLIAVGIVGYGAWGVLHAMDYKHQRDLLEKAARNKWPNRP